MIFITGCSSQSSENLQVDKAFRAVISPDVKVVAGIDLKRLKNTPLYQRHEEQLDSLIPKAGVERFGIDPRRDLEFLGFTFDGKHVLVFARGDFKKRKKLNRAQENRELVFLNDRIALAGDADAIRAARKLEEQGSGEAPGELASRLRILSGEDQVWLVSRGGIPLAQAPLRDDMKSNLANFAGAISGVTLGIAADSGSHLQATVSCYSIDGATRVHDAFRGIIGLARLTTKDNQTDLLKIYDAFQVKKDGSTVNVRADLAAAETERVLLLLPKVENRIPQ